MQKAKQIDELITLGEAEAEVTSWSEEIDNDKIRLQIEVTINLSIKKWWETMEKRKRIYIPKELYQKIERLAKMNGVSVSEYVEHLLMK